MTDLLVVMTAFSTHKCIPQLHTDIMIDIPVVTDCPATGTVPFPPL